MQSEDFNQNEQSPYQEAVSGGSVQYLRINKRRVLFLLVTLFLIGVAIFFGIRLFRHGGEPEISLSPLAAVFPSESEIPISVSWKNIPANSFMVLYVNRVTDDEGTARTIGPLMLKPKMIKGDGSAIVGWDGKNVGCAPTDAPEWCNMINVGQYFIEALVYDSRLTILGHPKPEREEVKQIAKYVSSNFNIEGVADISRLKNSMSYSILTYFQDESKTKSYMGTRMERYFKKSADFTEIDEGVYCMSQELTKPFFGVIKACTTRSVVDGERGLNFDYDDIEISGTITQSTETMSYDAALKKAEEFAKTPYLSRVRFDHQPTRAEIGSDTSYRPDSLDNNSESTTYLGVGVDNWAYRGDGDYWIFILNIYKAGGSEDGFDRFQDKVWVRVDEKQGACVVQTVSWPTPEDSSVNFNNIFEDEMNCDRAAS